MVSLGPSTGGPSELSLAAYLGGYILIFVEWRGITFLLSSIIFHVLPTALEISMVCGILVSSLWIPIRVWGD